MEKKQFKAESQRLMDLMINSIYTHKEIFLREIISNASDAIDKLAYRALTDDQVGLNRDDFKIVVVPDKEARTLTVSDNGIGMTQEEMENNLGTIAKSGSLQFKKETEKTDDAEIDIIGQFGVGFYSAFMVADKVTVISKAYGADTAYKWESEGVDGYTIEPCEKDTVGTDVIMSIKPDSEEEKYDEYLEAYKLSGLIKKYSDYIRYPIRMEMEHSKPKPKPEDAGEDYKPEYETVKEWETINSMIPIWQRPKSQVKDEEYNEFYKSKFGDWQDPLLTIHVSAEGSVEYKALLYIPGQVPMNYFTTDFKKGLQLYSSGVMIMDKCPDLLPDHFSFVQGIVDTPDLSLNISREMLQHDRQLKFIANNLEKKIKQELVKLMTSDREKYEKFYGAFGTQLKYGVLNDYGAKKELLQDLLLYWSAKENKLVSLKEYADAMPEAQKYIYYASAESRDRAAKLPQIETLREKGFDVLLMTDEVDGFVPQTLQKYGEKDFRSVTQDDLGIQTDEEKKAAEEKAEQAKTTLDFVKETLGERVKEVKLSDALGSHPVCVVPGEGMTFEMEKYFKRVSPEMDMKAEKVLELNAAHPMFAKLQIAVAQEPEKAKKIVEILYAQALLMADLPLEDPGAYSDLVCELLG